MQDDTHIQDRNRGAGRYWRGIRPKGSALALCKWPYTYLSRFMQVSKLHACLLTKSPEQMDHSVKNPLV